MNHPVKACSVRVYSNRGYDNYPCSKPATVQRDGKWYCTIHDPERLAAKRAAKVKEWADKGQAEKARQDAAVARTNILGGRPYYSTIGVRGYTGGITLTPDEADALIARLESR